MAVLGISINSRVIGIAIIENKVLIDCGVKMYKQRWSIQKAEKIIADIRKLVSEFSINKIAIAIQRKHFESEESKALNALIKASISKNKLPITYYDPNTFDAFCDGKKAKKKVLMKCLVVIYPELVLPFKKELRNHRRHYHKLFEAVAAATLLSREMEIK